MSTVCSNCKKNIHSNEITTINANNQVICSCCGSVNKIISSSHHYFWSKHYKLGYLSKLFFVIIGAIVFNEINTPQNDEMAVLIFVGLIICFPYYRQLYNLALKGNLSILTFFVPDNLPTYEVTTKHYRGGNYIGEEKHTETNGGEVGFVLGLILFAIRIWLSLIALFILTFLTIVTIIPFQFIMSIVRKIKSNIELKHVNNRFSSYKSEYGVVIKDYPLELSGFLHKLADKHKSIHFDYEGRYLTVDRNVILIKTLKSLRKIQSKYGKKGLLISDYYILNISS